MTCEAVYWARSIDFGSGVIRFSIVVGGLVREDPPAEGRAKNCEGPLTSAIVTL